MKNTKELAIAAFDEKLNMVYEGAEDFDFEDGYKKGYKEAKKDIVRDIKGFVDNLDDFSVKYEPIIESKLFNIENKDVITEDCNKWSREAFKRGAKQTVNSLLKKIQNETL